MDFFVHKLEPLANALEESLLHAQDNVALGPPLEAVEDMETLEDVLQLSVILVQVVADVVTMFPDEDDAVVGEGVG